MKKVLLLLIVHGVCAQAFAVNPQVTLEISGGVTGTIVLELYADKAPITVANFLDYVQSGFYDGLIFHAADSFAVDGGGYDITLVKQPTNPSIINESINGLVNLRGTIAMDRANLPHSATSIFYINRVDNESLDFGTVYYDLDQSYYGVGYCVFGEVVSGMDVVDAIGSVATTNEGVGLENVPETDIVINSARVTLSVPVCSEKLAGDINEDCYVNLVDFAILSSQWLMDASLVDILIYDFDDNGITDEADLIAFVTDWLTVYEMDDFAIFSREWLETETWYAP